ncbi:MAG: hypothetical protein KDD69_09610 [Bdellovibrionales bacterium]|nr:hypothetical protein [Bdellovibrionales bacterium]
MQPSVRAMNFRDKNLQNLLLLIVVVVAVLPAALRIGKEKPTTAASAPAAPQEPGSPVVAPASQQPQERRVRAEQVFRVKGSRDALSADWMTEQVVTEAPESIGAKWAMLEPQAGKAALQVQFTNKARCMEGDADIIREELRQSPHPNLILTFESLGTGAGSFERQVHHLAATDVVAGRSFTFTVPLGDVARHAGLFLCLDTAEEGSCLSKPVTDLAAVSLRNLKRARRRPSEPDPGAPRDKTYYFQYLFLDTEQVLSFNSLMDEGAYPELATFLTTRAVHTALARDVAEYTRRVNGTLRSLPVQLTRRAVVINLPRYDRAKCEEKGITLPPALREAIEKRGGTIRPRT